MLEQFIPDAPMETWPGDQRNMQINNFAIEGTTREDITLFLGPFRTATETTPAETVSIIPEHWTLAHIRHAVGAFPSVKQAKANGWNRPIPNGFSDFDVGKRKIPVCVLGKLTTQD
jgi:hypothetical protein